MRRSPSAVDAAPLRIRGEGGAGLYRSALEAGAPPQAIQSWLRVIGKQMPISQIRASDEYDIVLDYRRAETGEIETGKLLYAGLIPGGTPKLSKLEWPKACRPPWFEASGVGVQPGGMVGPSGGRIP